MSNNVFELIEALRVGVNQLNQVLIGGDTESVTIEGVTRPSIAKALYDSFAAIQASVVGRLAYATKAAMDADLAHAANTLAEVWNDATAANNGLYGKTGASGSGSWTKSPYDSVGTLEAKLNAIDATLQTLGLDRLANFFPNGALKPGPITGVVWSASQVSTNGNFGTGTHQALTQADINAMGIGHAYKLPKTTGNRHAIVELPTTIGGYWLIMSWITYAPSGVAAEHGNNQGYIGKNGALGDGFNGCTDITYGNIDLNAYVRIHWMKCKLFTSYTSAQAWVGASTGGSTTNDVYLTGFNVTWSTNSAVGVLSTSYNDFTPSPIQDRILALEVASAALSAVKKDKEVPLLTSYVNAVTDRYATRSTTPEKHLPLAADAKVTYPFNQKAYDLLGEPNVIKGFSNIAGRYTPAVVVKIMPEDLAKIGVVPNDATPPRVSFRAGHLYQGLNQTYGSQQVFFLLQYSDAAFNPTYGSSIDVLFNGAGAASYLGAGDAFWAHTAGTASKVDEYRVFYHNNVPIPATYLGKPFRGIKIIVLGYATNDLTAYDKEVYGFAFALVPGASIEPLKPYLNQPDDVVGYVGIQDVQRLDKEMSVKVPGHEDVVYRNAVKNRFGPVGSTVSSNIGGLGTLTYHRDAAIFTQDGARSVLKAVHPTAQNYYPMVSVTVSPDDLADLGIVPNDVTPPLISLKAAYVKSLAAQHASDNIQIFFQLRYGGTLGPNYTSSRDVLFINGNATPNWVGAGDSTTWSHVVTTNEDTLKKGYVHSGVKLPANYNGLPFTGIVISLLGYPNVGVTGETTIAMTDVAVVAGSVLRPSELLLNSPDDYPKVGNIQQNQLSEELRASLVFKGEGGEVANYVTIQNSDKIVLLGDSFTASHYTMKDKAYISRLGELTDWRVENFARSGDDYAEINERILTEVGEYHPSLTFKEYGGTYALLISFTNDTYHRSRNLDYFFDNVRRVAQTVMSCGLKPILATEFVTGNAREFIGLSSIARELGIEYVDIASNARLFNQATYAQYWGGGHPAARTNGLFYDPLLPHVNALPRPKQSIKLFRKRSTFAIVSDSDLLYDNIDQRVRRWKEITVGHHSLVSRLAPYYDRLADISTGHGGYSYDNNTSEYLKLQNKESVSLGDYALAEVILPATAARVTDVFLNLSDPSVQVFCRNALQPESWSGYNKRQAFQVDELPAATVGDTYTYSGQTFTVVGATTTPEGEKVVLFSPYVWGSAGGGTLTRATGSSPVSIAFSATFTGFDVGYYSDLYKPRGVWKQLTNSNGRVAVSGAALQEAMQYDKLVFMLKKTGGLSLSDISVEWYGEEGKDYRSLPNPLPRAGGTQLLASTKFATAGSWTLEGGASSVDPHDGVLPVGCTKLVKVDATKRVSQAFNFTADSRYAKEFDVVVWARRYPAHFSPSADEPTALTQYQTTAPINSDTCDYRNLRIQLDSGSANSAVKVDELVGLHWREVRVRVQAPCAELAGTSLTLRLSCPEDELELALAEVWAL